MECPIAMIEQEKTLITSRLEPCITQSRPIRSSPTMVELHPITAHPTNSILICTLPEQSSPVQRGTQSHVHDVGSSVPSFWQVPSQTVRERQTSYKAFHQVVITIKDTNSCSINRSTKTLTLEAPFNKRNKGLCSSVLGALGLLQIVCRAQHTKSLRSVYSNIKQSLSRQN